MSGTGSLWELVLCLCCIFWHNVWWQRKNCYGAPGTIVKSELVLTIYNNFTLFTLKQIVVCWNKFRPVCSRVCSEHQGTVWQSLLFTIVTQTLMLPQTTFMRVTHREEQSLEMGSCLYVGRTLCALCQHFVHIPARTCCGRFLWVKPCNSWDASVCPPVNI